MRKRLMPPFRGLVLGTGLAAVLSVTGCATVATPAGATMQRANAWTVPGVLRVGAAERPTGMNPLIGDDAYSVHLSMFWGGYLFNWSDENRFVPELAVAVPTLNNGGISADGRTITYHLRQGVRWQDGAPFTADDVIFTWHAIMNPKNDVPGIVGYDVIRSIDKLDDYTLVVHLYRPFAPFVATFLTMGNDTYCVLPKHLLARYASLNHVPFNRMPVGTGPFQVVFNDGKVVKMVANRDYWRGPPGLREVDFYQETSQQAVLDDLRHHRIDLAIRGGYNAEPELHDIPGTTVYLYPFDSFTDLGFNLSRPIVQDRLVRQALAYATNREAIIDQRFNGVSQPASADQPSFSWASATGMRRYPYDPVKARQLLAEAGWRMGPDGIRMNGGRRLHLVIAATDASPSSTVSLIQRQWREVGVDADIRGYSAQQLYAPAKDGGIEASGRFDVILETWVNGVDPDDSLLFMCSMAPPTGENDYHYCDPALDAAEREATTDYDPARRKAAYARIQGILAQDVPMIDLWFYEYEDVANVDLRYYRPASFVTPFWNTWQYRI